MNEQSKTLYLDTKVYFSRVISSMKDFENSVVSVDDSVDAVYSIRESLKYLDEVKKTLNAFSEEIQEGVFLVLSSRGKKSRATDHCTATLKSKITYPIPSPKKSKEDYGRFMSYIGVPPQAVEDDSVRPHWPGIMNLCSRLNKEGEELPPGIDNTKGTPELRLTIRSRKDVDD